MPSNQSQAQSNISQATRKTLEYIHFDAAAMTLGIHFNVFVHFWIHVRGGKRGRGGWGKRGQGKRGQGKRGRGKRGRGRWARQADQRLAVLV